MRRLIIPNWISLAIVGLYPAYVLTSPVPPGWLLAAGLAALTLVVGFALFVANLMGGGDVKLMAAVALWAGPTGFPMLVIVTAIAGGLVAMALLLFRRLIAADGGGPRKDVMPYGVAIAAGGLMVALSLSKGG